MRQQTQQARRIVLIMMMMMSLYGNCNRSILETSYIQIFTVDTHIQYTYTPYSEMAERAEEFGSSAR